MHNLEQQIAEWRKANAPVIGRERIGELENHLREALGELIQSGVPAGEAWATALARLGDANALAAEFRKVEPGTYWPLRIGFAGWIVCGMALLFFVKARIAGQIAENILAVHAFTITMGYSASLIVGAVGICSIGQGFFAPLSPSESQRLVRPLFNFSVMAWVLSLLGVILGMVWASIAWGRAWGWDAKECGGLAVLVWQVAYICFQRSKAAKAQITLLLGLVGNFIVTCAWFAPMNSGGAATFSRPVILISGATYLALLILGFLSMKRRAIGNLP